MPAPLSFATLYPLPPPVPRLPPMAASVVIDGNSLTIDDVFAVAQGRA